LELEDGLAVVQVDEAVLLLAGGGVDADQCPTPEANCVVAGLPGKGASISVSKWWVLERMLAR